MAHEATRTITILSFNIWKGGGGKYENEHKNDAVIPKPSRSDILPVYKSIADVVLREKADIVALQEVDRETARTAYLDAAKEIAAQLESTPNQGKWLHSFFKAKTVGKQPGKFHRKEYGNAILSRLVQGKTDCCELGNTGLHLNDAENRIAMVQEFIIPHDQQEIRLLVINLHLGLERDNQIFQLSRLQHFIESVSDDTKPIIVCGDFNIDALDVREANPRHTPLTFKELKKIFEQFKRKFDDQTPQAGLKTTFRNKKIDYFFFSDAPDPRVKGKLKCGDVKVVKNSARDCSSDHNALKLTLTVNR